MAPNYDTTGRWVLWSEDQNPYDFDLPDCDTDLAGAVEYRCDWTRVVQLPKAWEEQSDAQIHHGTPRHRAKMGSLRVINFGPAGIPRVCPWQQKFCRCGMTTPDGWFWPGCYAKQGRCVQPDASRTHQCLARLAAHDYATAVERLPIRKGGPTLVRMSSIGDAGDFGKAEAVASGLWARRGRIDGVFWPTRAWTGGKMGRFGGPRVWAMLDASPIGPSILCSMDASTCAAPPLGHAVGWIFPDARIPTGTMVCRHFTRRMPCMDCRWCFPSPGEPSRHVVFPLHGVFPPALGGARLGTYVYMPKEIDDAGRLVNHDGATAYLLDYWARQGVDYYGRA